MAWTIEVDEQAAKQFRKLGKAEALRIRNFLRERVASLDNPRLIGKPLQGAAFAGLWRYRVGDYRIVCDIQDGRLVVLVLSVGHRREVYR